MMATVALLMPLAAGFHDGLTMFFAGLFAAGLLWTSDLTLIQAFVATQAPQPQEREVVGLPI